MKKVFKLAEDSIIYVVCPANNKTGGTELLHQLVYQLNDIGRIAVIAYYLEGSTNKKNPIPEEFKKYVKDFCYIDDIVDDKENVLILPEVCIGKHKKFKKIQKTVWWLSVDNYFATLGKLNRLKRYGFASFLKHLWLNDYSKEKDLFKIQVHLYQSYYAADFLENIGVSKDKMWYLSDYINDIYITEFDKDKKEDIVIYNPKKGYEFTLKLIEKAPHLKWIPIQNMTNSQVQDLMHSAKVYIDFGNHPGKDRIPREAAMSGCCVITNMKGSAAYSNDVPINEKFKFYDENDENDENILSIISTIEKCIKDYNEIINDFAEYRTYIKNEKTLFEKNVNDIFS